MGFRNSYFIMKNIIVFTHDFVRREENAPALLAFVKDKKRKKCIMQSDSCNKLLGAFISKMEFSPLIFSHVGVMIRLLNEFAKSEISHC